MTNLTGNISDIGVLWNEIRRLRAVAKGVDISKIDEAMPMTGREQEEFKQWAMEKWGSSTCHTCGHTKVDFSKLGRGK